RSTGVTSRSTGVCVHSWPVAASSGADVADKAALEAGSRVGGHVWHPVGQRREVGRLSGTEVPADVRVRHVVPTRRPDRECCMKALTLLIALTIPAVASAQEPPPQQYQQPQPYFQPVGPPVQRYQMVVPPGA